MYLFMDCIFIVRDPNKFLKIYEKLCAHVYIYKINRNELRKVAGAIANFIPGDLQAYSIPPGLDIIDRWMVEESVNI